MKHPDPARRRELIRHAASVAAILVISCLLFYKYFYTRGTLMHVDMTFPTTIDRNIALYNNAWWQYGSVMNVWNLQRVLWSYPLLFAVKLAGMNVNQYLLVMYTGSFFLAGVSMYALAFRFIRSPRIGATRAWAPHAGAVFSAAVFMYNPWSLSHLWPYFGYPGYAVLPLVFLLLVKAADAPAPRYVIPLALLTAVASTGPICVVWFWFLIITYLLYTVAMRRFSRESLASAVKVLVPAGLLYALLSAVWIMPYLYPRLSGKAVVPTYMPQMSQRLLDVFSASNSVMNNMRLASGWGMPVDPQVSGAFWVIMSFAAPALSILAVALLLRKPRRDGIALYWSLMFVVSVLLATGTSFMLRGPYSYFILRGPGSQTFGWMLRAFDRWLVYAPVFFALMLGLLVTRLLGSRGAARTLLAALVVAAVLLSFWPIASAYARTVYNPTKVPPDYAQVNDYIERTAGDARVAWLPFARDGFHYYWAPEKRIGTFNTSSSNPNLNNLHDLFAEDNFYYWLESMFRGVTPGPFNVLDAGAGRREDLASRLFVPFAARYLILDSSVPGYNFADNFEKDPGLELAHETPLLKVFEFKDSAGYIRPASRAIVIDNYYDELAIAQKLEPEQLSRVSFLDRDPRSAMDERYGVLDLDDYREYFDINGSFEEAGPDGGPAGWTRLNPSPSVKLSTGAGRKPGGRGGLLVTNRAHQEFAMSWISGPEVAVEPGEIYCFQTSIRYENAKWTYATLQGYDPALDRWVSLANCPPVNTEKSSGWKRYSCSVCMPAGYTRIRPALSAGWTADLNRGAARSWFDGVRLSRISDRFYGEISGAPEVPEVTWEKVSGERCRVRVRGAKRPFTLVFGEAYDPLWGARTDDGRSIEAVRQYSVITGFPLEEGDSDLTIEYLPQRRFTLGLAITLVTLVLCLGYLPLPLWRRRKARASSPGTKGR